MMELSALDARILEHDHRVGEVNRRGWLRSATPRHRRPLDEAVTALKLATRHALTALAVVALGRGLN